MERTVENVRFNVLRNALYHTGRRMAFERWNRFFNFLVVVLGAAATGGIITEIGINAIWPAGAVAVVGAAQLVFDFGRMSRDHQTLQREYYHLLADIEQNIAPTQQDVAAWYAKMTRIAGDEPPVLRAKDAKAYNDAIDALEWGREERLKIPFWHVLFGWIWPFEGYNYKKFCELPGKNEPKQIAA